MTELSRWKAAGEHFDYLGFDVFYRREGSGPVLLLIHGYPFSSWDWHRVWPALTARFTVIAPDMLGLGFSDKPPAYGYSVLGHADMHEALLAHLGVRSAHLMAHDLGVSVGQELLARRELEPARPGPRLDSITWLNGGLFHEAYRPRLIQTLLSRTPLGDLLSPLQGSAPARRLTERTIGSLFGRDTQPCAELRAAFGELLDHHDGRRVLHRVGRFTADRLTHRDRWVRAMRQTTVPMRFIDGPADPNSGRHMATRYQEVIAEPDVVLLADGVAHWPQLEAPDDVLAAFFAHVDRRQYS